MLRDELVVRCERNAAYSARAFARDVGLSPSFLSQVLSGRKCLADERARDIASALKWDEEKATRFLLLVRFEGAESDAARAEIQADWRRHTGADLEFRQIDADQFRIISDWYHVAIIELAGHKDFNGDIKWLARRLAITALEARGAVERLLRAGLLERTSEGIRRRAGHNITQEVSSEAIRRFHAQMLGKAQEALARQAVDARVFNGVTLSLRPDAIPLAKEKMRRFYQEMIETLDDPTASSIFHFSMQLFRLDLEIASAPKSRAGRR